MAEQEQGTSQEQSTSTEQPQSLDQVYKQFNVEAEAQNFQPHREQPRQEQRQEQPKVDAIPDPVLDAQGYKTWVASQSQFVQGALKEIEGKVTAMQVQSLRSKEEADIKHAVQKFKSIAGDVDDDLAEIALGQKARKDPKFMTVYANRDKNPQAWNAALSAYANEFKSKNQMLTDPQIAENQRAAKQSIGSQTKTKTDDSGNPIENRLKDKTGSAFAREWRNIVDQGF